MSMFNEDHDNDNDHVDGIHVDTTLVTLEDRDNLKLVTCLSTWDVPTSSTSSIEPLKVVYSHGLTEDHTMHNRYVSFDHQSMNISHLLTYDVRGHGGSESPLDTSTYIWKELALDQLSLTNKHSIHKYVAAGASMGCATALYTYLLSPNRIEKLILIIPPTAYEDREAKKKSYREISKIIDSKGNCDFIVDAANHCNVPGPYKNNDNNNNNVDDILFFREQRKAALELWRENPDRLSRIFQGAGNEINNFPSRDELRTISVPVLILAWTDDNSHPLTTALELNELIPNSQLHVANTKNDFLNWTNIVTDFLKSSS